MSHQITRDHFDAVLFDLDGVLTATAKLHAAAWKRMFDAFLWRWATEHRQAFIQFDVTRDYLTYVDGKPRFDGVRGFLASRGIELPPGTPDDPAVAATVCGLGNWKNEIVNEILDSEKVEAYPESIRVVELLREAGYRTAVVSSSENCAAVLRSAGIDRLFDARIDAHTATELGLRGKPEPDMFLIAARRLAVDPARSVVVEDAIAGVQAGRKGGFGLVIGIARVGNADALREHGADIVVRDLGELFPLRP